MARSESMRHAQARRAYEVGRFKRALWFAPLPVPLVYLSFGMCQDDLFVGLVGTVLMLSLVGLHWRGQVYERAAWAGFVTGLGAYATPFLARLLHICPCQTAIDACLIFCFMGGALTGAGIGFKARHEPDRGRYLAVGGAVAILVGGIGCAIAGLGGALGMAVGLTVTAASVLALRRA